MSLFPRLIAEEAVEYGGKVRVLAPEVGATGVGKLARIAFDCSTEVLASTALGRPDQDLDGVLPKAKPGHVGRPSALFSRTPRSSVASTERYGVRLPGLSSPGGGSSRAVGGVVDTDPRSLVPSSPGGGASLCSCPSPGREAAPGATSSSGEATGASEVVSIQLPSGWRRASSWVVPSSPPESTLRPGAASRAAPPEAFAASRGKTNTELRKSM